MSSGLIFFRSSYPRPQRSIRSPVKLFVTMSDLAISLLITSMPFSVLRSTWIAFLDVLQSLKTPLCESSDRTESGGHEPVCRISSRRFDDSTLITSAPQSANTLEQAGPAISQKKSQILSPSRGFGLFNSMLIQCSQSLVCRTDLWQYLECRYTYNGCALR